MADTKQKKNACSYCEGTGKFKKPNDEEKYNARFDYHADKAYFISMGEAREKALADVGYTVIECPMCKGSGVRE